MPHTTKVAAVKIGDFVRHERHDGCTNVGMMGKVFKIYPTGEVAVKVHPGGGAGLYMGDKYWPVSLVRVLSLEEYVVLSLAK